MTSAAAVAAAAAPKFATAAVLLWTHRRQQGPLRQSCQPWKIQARKGHRLAASSAPALHTNSTAWHSTAQRAGCTRCWWSAPAGTKDVYEHRELCCPGLRSQVLDSLHCGLLHGCAAHVKSNQVKTSWLDSPKVFSGQTVAEGSPVAETA